MGIPQLNTEGVDQTGGSTAFTVSFAGFTWAVNDIIVIAFGTDGWVPSLTTANGFAIAQDPQGNTASVTTNGGVAGAADCGMFVYWKRAVGTTPTSDPPPVFAAPSASSGTAWCLEPNSYTGARTTGTPWHAITTSILGLASTAVTSPGVTSTLASCLFQTYAASSVDDQAFNNWTMTGSSGPAAGAPSTGWHAAAGNQCAFTGCDGGFAAAGGPRTATTTFASPTKQALISAVLASLAEASAPGEDVAAVAPPTQPRAPVPVAVVALDDLPGTAAANTLDEDPAVSLALRLPPAIAAQQPVDDDLPIASVASLVDETSPDSIAPLVRAQSPILQAPPDDEIPTAAVGGSMVDEDTAPAAWLARPIAAPLATAQSNDFVPTLTAVAIGGASDAQRSFNAAPATGTLTTVAPLPAWAQGHAYVIDPTAGGTNRVQNGGTLYQCSAPGTSAGSGTGPNATTIGTTQADGTVTWYVVGPVQGTDTIAGSQLVATIMRGNQSLAASIDPTDNDGGTYAVISNTSYGGAFPASFAGVWRRTTAANLKTGFTASAVWGGGSGAGDEMSIGWVELQGVVVGAPHAFSQVIRTSSTGGTVTAAAITTTKRCLILSYWFGEGTVQAAGAPDTATPSGGLTLIAGTTAPLSLTANGYIQHAVAWRMANAGTFSEVWLASPTDQGAQLVTVAFEDPTTPSLSVDEDSPRIAPLWAPLALPVVARSDDELLITAVPTEDIALAWAPTWAPPQQPAAQGAEEIPGQVIDDDSAQSTSAASPVRVVWTSTSDDDLPPQAVISVNEDNATPAAPDAIRQPVLVSAAYDEVATPVAASVVDDDGPATAWVPVRIPVQPIALAVDDDLPAATSSAVDEDVTSAIAMPRIGDAPAIPSQSDDLPVSAPSEDQWQPDAGPTVPFAMLRSSAPDFDDLPTAPVAPLEADAPPAWWSTGPIPLPQRAAVDDDAILTAPPPSPPIVDDDSSAAIYAPWRLYDWPGNAQTSDDVLPAGSALPQPPVAFYGVRVVSRYVAVLVTGRVTTVVIDGVPNG